MMQLNYRVDRNFCFHSQQLFDNVVKVVSEKEDNNNTPSLIKLLRALETLVIKEYQILVNID